MSKSHSILHAFNLICVCLEGGGNTIAIETQFKNDGLMDAYLYKIMVSALF